MQIGLNSLWPWQLLLLSMDFLHCKISFSVVTLCNKFQSRSTLERGKLKKSFDCSMQITTCSHQFFLFGFPKLEEETPQSTPNIVDLKMNIDAHLDHTFGVIKVIFEFLPLSWDMGEKPPGVKLTYLPPYLGSWVEFQKSPSNPISISQVSIHAKFEVRAVGGWSK